MRVGRVHLGIDAGIVVENAGEHVDGFPRRAGDNQGAIHAEPSRSLGGCRRSRPGRSSRNAVANRRRSECRAVRQSAGCRTKKAGRRPRPRQTAADADAR